MRSSFRWRGATFAAAALFAVAIAADLLWMPVQVHDALGEILTAQQTPSISAAFTGSFGTTAYLRPARIAQIKALFDAAGGRHYWLAYRGFHAALLIAAVLLFAAALRVETATDFGAAAVALTVLIGLHTFRGTVQEAFPINHFLEMVVGALVLVNLARGSATWWKDMLAVLVFAMAMLTLESGLLIWVVAATAWGLGWRGVSVRGVGLMTLLVIAYLGLRFAYLETGVPSLAERSAGYLFGTLDPPELAARFGARPVLFYVYNVAASALSVLFSEPRSGVFEATRGVLDGRVPPRVVLVVVTSCAMTACIVWAAVRLAARRALDDSGRLLVLFVVMLGANAALSFAYTKDEIISVAGAFYALAAYAAVREALRATPRLRLPAAVVVVGLLAALAGAWSVRAAGVHYLLRAQAIRHQNDWAELPHSWRREQRWPEAADARQLILQLRRDAYRMRVPNPRIGRPEWTDRLWFD